MYLLLPFLAALAFALGSMVFKRSYEEGAGVVHAVVVNNVLLGICFLPLLLLDHQPVPWKLLHLPLLASLPFAFGHLMNVLSLRVGDVSVATPLLGVKVTFVALIAWLVFHQPLTKTQWLASGLTTAGVLIMGLTDFRPGRRTGLTTLLALACAGSFALTDILIQLWAGRVGVWNFLALQFAGLGAVSACALPLFGFQSLRVSKGAWRWVLFAVFLSGLQAILITSSIGIWKDAAGVNVIYATRGLLSIALVWFIGHRMKNSERNSAGPKAMFWRVAGAGLILIAVALAVGNTRR